MYWFRYLFLLAVCLASTSQSFQYPFARSGPRNPSSWRLQAHHNWQSHVSTHPDGFNAFKQIWSDVTHKSELDICFLFIGQAHAADFDELVQHARLQISGSGRKIRLVSLLGGGVIGENVELDQMERPSMSLLIGSLPEGSEVEILEYSNQEGKDEDDNLQLDERFSSCLVFADPWAPVEKVISSSGLKRNGRVLAGGISCPYLADQSSLAVDNRCLPQGSIIAVGFTGNLGLQTLVAQGCRPIGSIFRVTECDSNVIIKLDNKPALDVLQEFANKAPPEEQKRIETGLLCGVCSSDDSESDDDGPDFLSRQIMGFVPAVKGIAIAATKVQEGDLFCFQVRDGETAQQDLKLMVQRAKTARLFDNAGSDNKGRPLAALQISCVARGRGMFDGQPNVDLSKVKQLVDTDGGGFAPIVGGFFANGEIGGVGLSGFSTTRERDGQSYLHSFTTVAAILYEYTKDTSSSDGVMQESSLDAWG